MTVQSSLVHACRVLQACLLGAGPRRPSLGVVSCWDHWGEQKDPCRWHGASLPEVKAWAASVITVGSTCHSRQPTGSSRNAIPQQSCWSDRQEGVVGLPALASTDRACLWRGQQGELLPSSKSQGTGISSLFLSSSRAAPNSAPQAWLLLSAFLFMGGEGTFTYNVYYRMIVWVSVCVCVCVCDLKESFIYPRPVSFCYVAEAGIPLSTCIFVHSYCIYNFTLILKWM